MKKGFTLIELLVVLVVVGILIALILPNTLKAIRQANNKECASNLRSVDTAIQLCYSETRAWSSCDTIAKLVTGKYLENTPACPFNVGYSLITNADGSISSDKTAHFSIWPARSVSHIGS